jgi:hypothetical protein
LDAVRAHPDSGPIADEAYQALTLETADPTLRATSNPAIQEVTAAILHLATFRWLFSRRVPPRTCLPTDGPWFS